MAWSHYVALGDSLSAGKGDLDPAGHPLGWPTRFAALVKERTGEDCSLTNLAADRATVTHVLAEQLPALASTKPGLLSITVGMNDIRAPEFTGDAFAADLRRVFDELAATRATLLTCTLPDIAERLPLPAELVPLVRDRMREVSEIIRRVARAHDALYVDAWVLPEVADPDIYSTDGLHPNARGHRLLATAFADLLAPAT